MNNIQHKNLANGRWQKMSFLEQMANIGSEVYRAINSKEKGEKQDALLAFNRSLELFDLSKESKRSLAQYKELCRMREIWVDYFKYNNEYSSTEEGINNYFKYLTIAYKNR
ncbi:MAG: hypothetical protein PHP08_01610 [Candidatus Dojkabacteria bacterium]|nr:hypothetical protein [Candidatus Dojkabacteria bacterium]